MVQRNKMRSPDRMLTLLHLFLLLIIGTANPQTINIGTGTSLSQDLPVNTHWVYNYSQQIFKKTQINTAGSITNIRFYYSSGEIRNSSAWKIWIGHTSKTSFSSNLDWVPLASMTQVFDGSVTIPSSAGWMDIALSTPFEYNNIDNLVIAVDENTPGYADSRANWGIFFGGDNSGIYYKSNSTNPDPASPPAATSLKSSINRLQLEFVVTQQSFTSAITEQVSTNPALIGSTDQEIVRLKVVTTGSTNPLSISSVTFNTSGTTSVADITSAVCYYTTTSTLSTAQSFGSPVVGPNGPILFTGSKVLANGDNYFWLVYNISNSAVSGNLVDGTCTQFETSETELVRYPSVTDPVGSRTIMSPLSGTVTVGTGGTYNSLTGTGGLFEAINQVGLKGSLTANIISDLTEDGTHGLNEWVETPVSSNFKLLIQPSAAIERLISGNVSNAMIRMNGADRVTVNGSVSGNGKYLRFRNSNTSNNVLRFVNGATINTFKNCYFEGANASSAVISFNGGNNRYNKIQDSEIKSISPSLRPVTGVRFGDAYDSLNQIVNCRIYDFVTYGIFLSGGTGTYIDSCEVFMTTPSASIDVFGIAVFNTGATTPTYITKNRIYGLGGHPVGAVMGIYVQGASLVSTNVRIENNSIKLEPFTSGLVVGIEYNGYAANSISMHYNSIFISGIADGGYSSGIWKRTQATNFTVINNLVQNTRTNSFGSALHYAIYIQDTDATAMALNHNCYYTDGAWGMLGYYGTADHATLAAWQSASGKDLNSLSSNPMISFSTTLQPFSGSPLVNAGLPIVDISTDLLNDTRSLSAPTIGAYENFIEPVIIDWCNLQHPATYTKLEGATGPIVYAQVFVPDITEPPGQGEGIQSWIGYNSKDTIPNTWTNWIEASFNAQSGNNDEYAVALPASLPAGTYYYASRFFRTGGLYQYGGYPSHFWDGYANVSGVLTVNDNSISWANLQFPATAAIVEGGSATIYGRVYAEGVTSSADSSTVITVWVGCNTSNTNPSTWAEGNWNRAFFNAHHGNNDEYAATIGNNLAPGTYYYAIRSQLINDSYVYGGYSTNGGGLWDGVTNVSGVLTLGGLTLTPPVCQDFAGTFPPLGWARYSGILNASPILTPVSTTWLKDDWRNLTSPVNKSACINIFYTTIYHWLVTPAITLSSGTNYELLFNLALTAYGGTNPPSLYGTDDKFAVIISTNNGATWSSANTLRLWDNAGSPQVYNNIAFEGETITIPLTSYSGAVKIGFYGESTVSNADNDLFVDNVQIRAVPVATGSATVLGGSTNATSFGTTGTTIQFTVANGGDLTLTVDRIGDAPGGTPPGTLQNIAPQYWSITVTSGTVDGTYSITLDITGVPGVSNPATLHLLKREHASGTWTDLGVATSISGNLLTWTGLTSFSEFGIGSENDNPLPVELSAFNSTTEGRNVILSWETATEKNASKFVIERKSETTEAWTPITEVGANGNSNSPKKYNYTDRKLNSGEYQYRLKMIDNDGTFTYSDQISVMVGVPLEFGLSQNYPNPFNPSTRFDYQLPSDARVVMELYDITGARLQTLIDAQQRAGYYTFDFSAPSYLSTGVYIVRMVATSRAGEKPFVAMRKISMVK